ncbi:NAD(P)H-quinone oxidoreductase [Arhodomonas aquaeolei]|uniref:NAD(P)H-quinone oxidoreductase n=1 Tax=Arhodomonas aquaeolei TaxID=2369 RepID=UPI0021675276|nr:NAD(P)H-quinone oxidoreductase [Arhodomonas aquaeolei]MCS4502647.1 NAD(P)H-quinone oxidoreductase [Arhodomonas aquaeolei]
MQVWHIPEPGGADALTLTERPDPVPGPGQLVVRVRAAGVNRADVLQRLGHYPAPPGVVADVPGLEYAGEVEAVGEGCVQRRVGDRVMGLVGGGAYAERVLVHERETLPVPAGMDDDRAAAIPEAFLTAWRAIALEGGLRPGGFCVVRAATSGIGTAAVQLVRAMGARSLGTGRDAARLDAVRAHGMDAAFVDDGEASLADAVHGANGGEGADMILDLVGGDGLPAALTALRAEGTLVLVGMMGGRRTELNLGAVLMRRLTLRAMTMRSLPLERRIQVVRAFEAEMLPLFAHGGLAPVLDRTVAFAQAPEAHRIMESGQHLGKLVLTHG